MFGSQVTLLPHHACPVSQGVFFLQGFGLSEMWRAPAAIMICNSARVCACRALG